MTEYSSIETFIPENVSRGEHIYVEDVSDFVNNLPSIRLTPCDLHGIQLKHYTKHFRKKSFYGRQ